MTHGTDEVGFGYRIALFGKPTCFRGMRPLRTFHSGAEPFYPFVQYRVLPPQEIGLPLDTLRRLYPFEQDLEQ